MRASSVGDSSDCTSPASVPVDSLLIRFAAAPPPKGIVQNDPTGLAKAVSDDDQPHQGLELPPILFAIKSQLQEIR
jgi:hypothetical protein